MVPWGHRFTTTYIFAQILKPNATMKLGRRVSLFIAGDEYNSSSTMAVTGIEHITWRCAVCPQPSPSHI